MRSFAFVMSNVILKKRRIEMNGKTGQTAIESVVIIVLGSILLAGLTGLWIKYGHGNKQVVDFNYKFDTAYVLGDDGRFERIKIKAWKDWKDSDAVQIVKEDGVPIYTHLRNVKLTKEK